MSSWPHTFATQYPSVALSWLDDQFTQLSKGSTSTTSLAGAALVGFQQAGTGTVTRTLQAKVQEFITVTDFGAGGTSTDGTNINAAINAQTTAQASLLFVTKANYTLDVDISANGRLPAFIIAPGTTWGGSGNFKIYDSLSYGNQGQKNSVLVAQLGDTNTPNVDASAMLFLKKVTGVSVTSAVNPTGVFSIEKRGTGTTVSNSRANALFAEAVDYSGGAGSFVEGGRSHAYISAANGSGYGLISFAGVDATASFVYLIGHESEVGNKVTNAPTLSSFNSSSYSASFVATSGLSGTKDADAGFITNPFAAAGGLFQTGFLVAGSVADSGFGVVSTIVTGLNFRYGSYSWTQILAKNLTPIIRAANAAGSQEDNILFYDTSSLVIVGNEAVGTKLAMRDTTFANSAVREVLYGAADSGGAGFRMLVTAN